MVKLPIKKDILEQLKPLLYYCNVTASSGGELKAFCQKHHVPTKIYYIDPDTDKPKQTGSYDRKGALLKRIFKYLQTGKMPKATVYPKAVVNFDPLPKQLTANNKVYYGQYKNGDKQIENLVKTLTSGISPFCAKGQEVIRDFWSKGIVPTYADFAEAFLKKYHAHKTSDNPEWAYLNDLQKVKAQGKLLNKSEWKNKIRPEKSKQALDILNKVDVPS